MADEVVTIPAPGSLDELQAILLDELEPPEVSTDPEAISREIMVQILSAETDADMLAIGQATPWQELMGLPVELHKFHWLPSRYDKGAKVFFVVTAIRLDTGENVVLTTSGNNVLAQLINLQRRKRFPSVWKLVEADKETANGFKPLWLAPVETKAGK
jgi:hypothetical protein